MEFTRCTSGKVFAPSRFGKSVCVTVTALVGQMLTLTPYGNSTGMFFTGLLFPGAGLDVKK
jgi:hypothetical protein